MKDLIRKILKESRNGFEWIDDISEDLNFWLENKLLKEGDIVKITGELYNGTCGLYINLPSGGIKVKVLVRYFDSVLIEILDGFPTNCEYGDYKPGTKTFIWDDLDGGSLFIESINEKKGYQ